MSNVRCYMCPSFQKQKCVQHLWWFYPYCPKIPCKNTQKLKHCNMQHACHQQTPISYKKHGKKGQAQVFRKPNTWNFDTVLLEKQRPIQINIRRCDSVIQSFKTYSAVNKNNGHRLIGPFACKNLGAVCSCSPPSSANHFQTGLTLELLLDQRLCHENSLQGWNPLELWAQSQQMSRIHYDAGTRVFCSNDLRNSTLERLEMIGVQDEISFRWRNSRQPHCAKTIRRRRRRPRRRRRRRRPLLILKTHSHPQYISYVFPTVSAAKEAVSANAMTPRTGQQNTITGSKAAAITWNLPMEWQWTCLALRLSYATYWQSLRWHCLMKVASTALQRSRVARRDLFDKLWNKTAWPWFQFYSVDWLCFLPPVQTAGCQLLKIDLMQLVGPLPTVPCASREAAWLSIVLSPEYSPPLSISPCLHFSSFLHLTIFPSPNIPNAAVHGTIARILILPCQSITCTAEDSLVWPQFSGHFSIFCAHCDAPASTW